jgi:hypothetical protein
MRNRSFCLKSIKDGKLSNSNRSVQWGDMRFFDSFRDPPTVCPLSVEHSSFAHRKYEFQRSFGPSRESQQAGSPKLIA